MKSSKSFFDENKNSKITTSFFPLKTNKQKKLVHMYLLDLAAFISFRFLPFTHKFSCTMTPGGHFILLSPGLLFLCREIRNLFFFVLIVLRVFIVASPHFWYLSVIASFVTVVLVLERYA